MTEGNDICTDPAVARSPQLSAMSSPAGAPQAASDIVVEGQRTRSSLFTHREHLTFQGERLRPAAQPDRVYAEELAEVRSTAKLGRC